MVAHSDLVASWVDGRVESLTAWTLILVLFTIVFAALVQGPMLLLPSLSILFPSAVASTIGFNRLRRKRPWDTKTWFAYAALAAFGSTYCLVQYPGKVLPFSIVAGLLLGPACSLLHPSTASGKTEADQGFY